MKNLVVLGATGSIGRNTLRVVKEHPDRFNIVGLTADQDVSGMLELCQDFKPKFVVFAQASAAEAFRQLWPTFFPIPEILSGTQAQSNLVSMTEVDCVMAAIVGSAGLLPTLAAVEAGKQVLLANKETLVMAGELILSAAKKSGAVLLPIDSEHNAIFQCLPEVYQQERKGNSVKRIILTASGGPFRQLPLNELKFVTSEQACAHPNWSMGQKISVDSATMLNKGLELIEAHWLFGNITENFEVILHPESIIHSLVEYVDGSVLAQMANPDMRVPIAYALAWPERIPLSVKPLNLLEISQLNFDAVCLNRYPCLALAYEVIQSSGTAPTVLNAANEVAVQAFLMKQIAFPQIAEIIRATLDKLGSQTIVNLETVLEADQQAKLIAKKLLSKSNVAV